MTSRPLHLQAQSDASYYPKICQAKLLLSHLCMKFCMLEPHVLRYVCFTPVWDLGYSLSSYDAEFTMLCSSPDPPYISRSVCWLVQLCGGAQAYTSALAEGSCLLEQGQFEQLMASLAGLCNVCSAKAQHHFKGTSILPEQDTGSSLQAVAGRSHPEEGREGKSKYMPEEAFEQQTVCCLSRLA